MLWRVSTPETGKEPSFYPEKDRQGEPHPYDPWEIRNRFFRLKEDDNEAAAALLSDVGFFEMPDLSLKLLGLAMEKGSKQELVDSMLRESRRHDWVRGEDGWHGVRPDSATPFPARAFWEFWNAMRAEMKPKVSEVFAQRDYTSRFAGLMRLGPSIVVTALTFKDAIAASIRIDQLRKAKFKKCRREDCQIPFAAVGPRKRKYCCWECGHLVSVRKSRRA
jgi:hypothetical protein